MYKYTAKLHTVNHDEYVLVRKRHAKKGAAYLQSNRLRTCGAVVTCLVTRASIAKDINVINDDS